MKKPKSRTMRVLTRIINIRSWIDYDRTKASLKYLRDGFKKLFIPQVQTAEKDFNDVVKEYKLTEEDLQKQKNSLKRLSYYMLFFSSAVFIYFFYQLIQLNIMATILSLVVTCLGLVLAFRYHFWAFQIQQRKLGCTFEEWYRIGLKGEKE